ncbi:prenyltransferase [Planctomycetota bacterium]
MPAAEAPPRSKPWFKALRPFSFPASVLPLLLATAMAASWRQWRWDMLALEIAAVLLLHSIGNLVNDFFDFRSGVDTITDDDNMRPGRFLVKGLMVPKDIALEIAVCLALLAPAAAYLIWQGGWELLIFGALGLGGGYAYTGPPFNFKYRLLGEGCIFTVYGPCLMMGAAFAQTGAIEIEVLLMSIPIGMIITGILASGSLRDLDEEAKAGIRTLSRFLGRKRWTAVFVFLLLAPELVVTGYVIAGLVTPWALLSLIALLPSLPLAIMAVKNNIPQDIDALVAQRAVTPLVVLLTIAYLIAA